MTIEDLTNWMTVKYPSIASDRFDVTDGLISLWPAEIKHIPNDAEVASLSGGPRTLLDTLALIDRTYVFETLDNMKSSLVEVSAAVKLLANAPID